MVTHERSKLLALAALACMLVLAASCGALANEKAKGAQALLEVRAAWQEPREEFVPGEYLVRFQEAVVKEDALGVLGHAGMEVLKEVYFKPSRAFPDGLRIYHVKAVAGVRAEDAARVLKADSRVRYAAPNRKLYADGPAARAIPDDPLFGSMWGLNNTGQEFLPGISGTPDADIDAPEAWDIRHDAPTIVVADIDTGIQWNHPDLQGDVWVNTGETPGNGIDDDDNGYIDDMYGWDFVNEDNSVYDSIDDHGTHTAGTVGAVGNNAGGVTGVAWNVKIMCLKFLEEGSGNTDDAVEAFAYAWNNGADLTTNSWGYTGPPDEVLQDAMQACALLHACAAGNDSEDNDAGYPDDTHYPSSFPLDNVIAVAASEWTDNFAYFSCWGATTVDLAAPGHWILSTVPTDMYDPPYAYFGGTSMATPHVAGAAALLKAEYPDMPAFPGDEGYEPGDMTIKDLLIATVDKKAVFQGKLVSGGRLNLLNALLQSVPPAIDSAEATPTFGAPPLEVQFTASAHDDGEIVDKWWDFGDGSPDIHEFSCSHTYDSAGAFTAGFHVVDDDGLESVATVSIVAIAETTVIFVDDDGGEAYEDFFTQAMDAAGIDYAVVTPPVTLPADMHNAIIWNCGPTWSGTLSSVDQEFLSDYLDNGGRLFLSAQDVIWDLGTDNPFVRNYLHVTGADEDVGTAHVDGVDGDPVTDGLAYDLSYPFWDYSDEITPDASADAVFTNEFANACALRYEGAYRLVFLSFPFEAVPYVAPTAAGADGRIREADLAGSALLMWRVFHWLALAPRIDSFDVSPTVGEPPLLITCSASAHDPDGEIADKWWEFGDGSPAVHEFAAQHTYTDEGDYIVTFHVVDSDGLEAGRSAHVVVKYLPDISASPTEFVAGAAPGTTVDRVLTVANAGRGDLHFALRSREPGGASMPVRICALPADPNALDARGMVAAVKPGVRPADQGEVIASWPASAPGLSWGTGYDGSGVWVGHIYPSTYDTTDYEYTVDGALTGANLPTPWAGVWAGDMAWDGQYLWQVNVGGDNGIYQIDPADGSVISSIHDPDGTWDWISQRGLAYDNKTDTFYIGGWNEDIVYHIKGLSWETPGEIIDSFYMPVGIAGLAYHPKGVLWVTSNAIPDMVYAVNPEDGTTIASFAHPAGGSYLGAGLEVDEDGNLWMAAQNNMVYLVDSGMPTGLPWLNLGATSGVVAPAESVDVTLTFDAGSLDRGEYHGDLVVSSNDPDEPEIIIPLTFIVSDVPIAAFHYVGGEPNRVHFVDESVDPDGTITAWAWDFGDGQTSTEQNPVHQYAANGMYSVTLSVTDNGGLVGTTQRNIVVVNTLPRAAFDYEETDTEGEPNKVAFTDKSTDADGTIVGWSWDFGEPESGARNASTEQNPVHQYSKNGVYTVTLTVVDDSGGTDTVTEVIQVRNAPPVVGVTSPAGGELWVGEREVRWTATDVDNEEGDLAIKIEYSADGGATWKLIADNEANDGSYAWDTSKVGKGGKYIVKVTATDPDGGVGEGKSGEFTIVVLSRMVSAAPNPASDRVTFYYSIGSDGTLYIYDVAGKLVHSAELSSEANAYEWDLTSGGRPLANGLYLYLVVTGDGEKSEVGRLVISH